MIKKNIQKLISLCLIFITLFGFLPIIDIIIACPKFTLFLVHGDGLISLSISLDGLIFLVLYEVFAALITIVLGFCINKKYMYLLILDVINLLLIFLFIQTEIMIVRKG